MGTRSSKLRAWRANPCDSGQLRADTGRRNPADPDFCVTGFGASRDIRDSASLVAVLLLLEVPEDGARVDAEVARGLGAVAVVERQHLVDVVALELVLGVGEGQD